MAEPPSSVESRSLRPRRASRPGRVTACLLACWPLLATPAAAEEALFLDGFEGGDFCAWSANPTPGLVVESEPNDLLGAATAVSRCATVEGTIAAVDGDGSDFDFFRLDVAAPTLLRLTLERRDGGSDFVPYADVGASGASPLGLTPVSDDGSTTRQLWLPEAGSWYVQVVDERNWDRGALAEVASPAAGGNATTYRLTLDVESLPTTVRFLTASGEPHELPADGALVGWRLAAGTTESLDLAEVVAQELAPASPLDARLYVVADPVAAPATIAANDDQAPGTNVDPRLEAVALAAATPHLLLVDFYDLYDPDTGVAAPPPAPFELDLQFLPPPP